MFNCLPRRHKEAKALKATYYYTGKPCRRGHIDKRFTANGCCYTCSLAKVQKWREENPEHLAKIEKSRWKNNKEKRKKDFKRWAQNNKAKLSAKTSKRRADEIQATPAWVNLAEMRDYYLKCAKQKLLSGIDYTVDHIIPLRGKLVCGLHVPWNLQILTRSENSKKKNNFKGTYNG